jgi:hypothetical protein
MQSKTSSSVDGRVISKSVRKCRTKPYTVM